jgi:hypothetical protein
MKSDVSFSFINGEYLAEKLNLFKHLSVEIIGEDLVKEGKSIKPPK